MVIGKDMLATRIPSILFIISGFLPLSEQCPSEQLCSFWLVETIEIHAGIPFCRFTANLYRQFSNLDRSLIRILRIQ